MNFKADRLRHQPVFGLDWMQVLQMSESRLTQRAQGGCAVKMWELLCSKKPKAFKALTETGIGISLAEKLKINLIWTTTTFQEIWGKKPQSILIPSPQNPMFGLLSCQVHYSKNNAGDWRKARKRKESVLKNAP